MGGQFRRRKTWIFAAVFIVAAALLLPGLVFAEGAVVNVTDAPVKRHAKSGAEVRFLATPKLLGTRAAFIAQLTVKAGGKVPEHRDATEEYLYVLDGSGTIWIEDKKFEVRPGSLIYMPANAKVSFEAADKKDVTILQIFAPPGPEKKYDTWVSDTEK